MWLLNSSANHNKNRPLPPARRALLACAAVLLGPALPSGSFAADVAHDAACTAHSGPGRVALVELYTSEGCSSCPPAERWLGRLPALGYDRTQVVPLALHVDYWDYLGWRDRFADPRHGARQRETAARFGAKFVYTPQVLVNGIDMRLPWRSQAFADRIAGINTRAPQATLSLQARRRAGQLTVRVTADYAGDDAAEVYVALTQNNLETRVHDGENAGRTLVHHFVVRQWWGPLPVGKALPLRTEVGARLPADMAGAELSVAAFVQVRASGEVVQALAATVCTQ